MKDAHEGTGTYSRQRLSTQRRALTTLGKRLTSRHYKLGCSLWSRRQELVDALGDDALVSPQQVTPSISWSRPSCCSRPAAGRCMSGKRSLTHSRVIWPCSGWSAGRTRRYRWRIWCHGPGRRAGRRRRREGRRLPRLPLELRKLG